MPVSAIVHISDKRKGRLMRRESEIEGRARFDEIRYGQCWEDADVLLAGLGIAEGDTCLSIASAGDNTLAMAGAGAGRIVAVDLSVAQIACLELRMAAIRNLAHHQFLALLGQSPHLDRESLYRQCRHDLSKASRRFWDENTAIVRHGIARGGKFERYLALFRTLALPLVQSRSNIESLFRIESAAERRQFYDTRWNNWRWRLACRLFFDRRLLGRFGRDPGFTRYADETIWESLERRIPHALTVLSPNANPYLQWILKGTFDSALPWAWRAENYEAIRSNLDAIEIHRDSLENALRGLEPGSLNACNLSDIFEYMSAEGYEDLLRALVRTSAPGCRLVYWNVVVSRSRPAILTNLLKPLRDLATRLHLEDKAFFYRDLIIEEVR